LLERQRGLQNFKTENRGAGRGIPNRNPTIMQIYIKHVIAATFKIDKKHVQIICIQIHLTVFMDML
jgi:hypothetical protein